MPKIAEIERTPNPNAMKFVLKAPLTYGASRSFDSRDQATGDPLAKALFEIPHITNVFYVDQWITVTQDGGDYTVHVVVGVDPDRRLWLLDMWRGQSSSDKWVDAMCDLVTQWKPIGWAEETGQIRAGIGPFLDQRMRQRQAFVARTQFPTRGDKAVRAQSIRGRMALDGLYIPQAAPWRAGLEAERMSFPAGKHDDIVDALGLLGQLLDKMAVGERPNAAAKPRDSWDRAFGRANTDDADAWKVA